MLLTLFTPVTAFSQISLQVLWGEAVGIGSAMDPLSELQDDLTLDDTSQALNQLKLASIDEKNWPSDEMPDFPKSGGHHWISGIYRHLRWGDPFLLAGGSGRADGGKLTNPSVGLGAQALLGSGPKSTGLRENTGPAPRLSPHFAIFLR